MKDGIKRKFSLITDSAHFQARIINPLTFPLKPCFSFFTVFFSWFNTLLQSKKDGLLYREDKYYMD